MKIITGLAIIITIGILYLATTAEKPDQWEYRGTDIATAVHYAISTGEYRSVKIEWRDGAYIITCK